MYEYFRPDLYNYTHTHKQGKPQENEKIISKEKSMRETIIHKTSHKELALKQDKPSYKKKDQCQKHHTHEFPKRGELALNQVICKKFKGTSARTL